MTAETPDVKTVFGKALAIESPEERAEFLDRACVGNAALRSEVEALLGALEGADSFMENKPGGLFAPTIDHERITEKPGSVIGPYKLLQQIGEGGMGVVYMAEQTAPVRRKVALKIIKPGMDTKEVVARFEAERQALALMDHPNIARVFDAGATDSGRPYFVMELVKGVPITEYCDKNNLPARERLELFVTICRAIQHAHHKGIIHRDIKPSNIMVTLHDSVPVPKVIDFGVAKATSQQLTEKTMFTAYGQMIGTPAYMSPEQAEMSGLDIDTRSDVYSLGVLLYELLTGGTPFDGKKLCSAGYAEMQRIIREEEPPKPSTRLSTMGDERTTVSSHRGTDPRRLGQFVRGDLDWIVMKSLDKDRNRRYESANSFAADIGRFLSDEVVEACPPSATYRFRKFARRNKTAMVTGTTVAAILIVASILSTALAVKATRAQRLASDRLVEVRAEQKNTRDALMSAENERDQASTQRDRAVAAEELAGERLAEVEQQKSEVEKQRDRAVTAEKLAGDRLAEVERQKGEVESQRDRAAKAESEAKREAAIAQAVVNFLKTDLLAQAGPNNTPDRDLKLRTVLDRAAAKIKGRFKEKPSVEVTLRMTISATYYGLGEYAKAELHALRAFNLASKTWGKEHPQTLTAMLQLAYLYHAQGRFDQAETMSLEVLEARRRLLGEEHMGTVLAMNNLAITYGSQNKFDMAAPLTSKVLEITRRLLGSEHPDTLAAMNNLAMLYRNQSKLDQAAPMLLKVLQTQRRVLGAEHPSTLMVMHNLALVYRAAGRFNEAESMELKTLEIRRRVLGAEHPHTLTSLNNLASIYTASGRFDEAESMELKVLEIRRRVLGAEHPHTLTSMESLASIYKASGRLKQALKLRGEYLRIRLAKPGALGSDDFATLHTMNALAWEYRSMGMLDQAEPLFRQILQAHRKTLTAEHRLTIDCENHLGVCLTMMDRFADAEQHLLNSHRDIQRAKDVPSDWLSLYCGRLARLYERWEKPEQSTLWRERLVAAELPRLADMPRDTSKRAGILANVGLTLLKLHQYDKAEPLLRECLAIREKKLPDHWLLFHAKSLLGGALLGQKKFAEAEPLLLQGYEGLTQREAKIPSSFRAIRLSEAVERLVNFYETRAAEGDAEQAAKWKAELEKRQAAKKPELRKEAAKASKPDLSTQSKPTESPPGEGQSVGASSLFLLPPTLRPRVPRRAGVGF